MSEVITSTCVEMDVYDEASLYCAAFDWPVDAEVDWLLSEVGLARNVLEPFCGNARYGRAFAKRGLDYWGVERSSAMLKHAEASQGIHVVHADARSFSIPGLLFDLAWCPINSIRHLLTDEDFVAHLTMIRRHLSADGVYVVESDLIRQDGGALLQLPRGAWTIEQPDGSVVDANWQVERYDLAGRRTFERATVRRRREWQVLAEISHVYEMRMLTFDEWKSLVGRSGFEVAAVHAHRSSSERPRVEFSAALENGPDNYYFILRAVK